MGDGEVSLVTVLRNMDTSDLTLAEIAEAVDCTASHVCQVLRANNLPYKLSENWGGKRKGA